MSFLCRFYVIYVDFMSNTFSITYVLFIQPHQHTNNSFLPPLLLYFYLAQNTLDIFSFIVCVCSKKIRFFYKNWFAFFLFLFTKGEKIALVKT